MRVIVDVDYDTQIRSFEGKKMTNRKHSPKSHDKWMAVLIWLALLAGLVYTSGSSATLVFGGSMTNLVRTQVSLNQVGMNGDGVTIGDIAHLVFVAALLSQLVNAWLKFVTLTNELIVANAGTGGSGEMGELFLSFLLFETSIDYEEQGDDEREEKLDPEDADGTLVGDVVRPLAYAWVIMIGSPAVISMVSRMFG